VGGGALERGATRRAVAVAAGHQLAAARAAQRDPGGDHLVQRLQLVERLGQDSRLLVDLLELGGLVVETRAAGAAARLEHLAADLHHQRLAAPLERAQPPAHHRALAGGRLWALAGHRWLGAGRHGCASG
jgi:hypothetical protein